MSGTIGLICAAVVAIPGVRYALGALRRRSGAGLIVQRVARLADLAVDKPQLAALTGQREDAWTVYPEQTLGRVWLVLRESDSTSPEKSKLDVFSDVCPHLGCAVSLNAEGEGFFCPCHKAAFDAEGKRTGAEEGKEHHSPRDLDSLDYKIVQDEPSGPWWVEVAYQKFEVGLDEPVPKA